MTNKTTVGFHEQHALFSHSKNSRKMQHSMNFRLPAGAGLKPKPHVHVCNQTPSSIQFWTFRPNMKHDKSTGPRFGYWKRTFEAISHWITRKTTPLPPLNEREFSNSLADMKYALWRAFPTCSRCWTAGKEGRVFQEKSSRYLFLRIPISSTVW